MARAEGVVVLYAAELRELTAWIGVEGAPEQLARALRDVCEDEDAGWEGELRPVCERLLRRIVVDGDLYAGLDEPDRYYLTQVLIDLFDQYVDAEALSGELPLHRLLEAADRLPSGARPLLLRLLRGREIGADGLLWTAGPFERVQPYLGYLEHREVAELLTLLERTAWSGVLRPVLAAARECRAAEMDLVSLVGLG
jgi:hypothetical protein